MSGQAKLCTSRYCASHNDLHSRREGSILSVRHDATAAVASFGWDPHKKFLPICSQVLTTNAKMSHWNVSKELEGTWKTNISRAARKGHLEMVSPVHFWVWNVQAGASGQEVLLNIPARAPCHPRVNRLWVSVLPAKWVCIFRLSPVNINQANTANYISDDIAPWDSEGSVYQGLLKVFILDGRLRYSPHCHDFTSAVTNVSWSYNE